MLDYVVRDSHEWRVGDGLEGSVKERKIIVGRARGIDEDAIRA
jgi:hypothetical protein